MRKVILIMALVVCVCIVATLMLNGFSSDSTTAVNNTASTSTEVNGTSDNNKAASDNSAAAEGKSNNGAATDSTGEKASGNTVSAEKTEVEIGSEEGTAESAVIIPISIKSVPKDGIGSCNFSVKYDTSVLEAVEVTPGDVIGKNTSNLDYSIVDSTGIVSFLFASSNDGRDSISKPGAFAKIKFKIKKDAKKGLTKITRELNGVFGDTSLKKVDAEFTQGGITVK